MKKLLFILLLPFCCVSQTSKLDEKNGFGNYTFGTAPAAYKNLVLELDEGNTKLYTSPKTAITVEGVEVDNVNVTFVKDKLSSIVFNTKNSTGGKLLQTLKQLYGEPKVNSAKGIYEWVSSKVQLLYEAGRSSADAAVSIYSRDTLKKK
ncbi:MAG: hypothetical protein K0S32_1368 [Bacteroidetes bacterium]|nr:hypothetical protein [Bacteroidota bacterium]